MNLLELAYTTNRHKDWLAMAHQLGAGHYAEDIVQEMYIKLYELPDPQRILDSKNSQELVGYFVYLIIRNMIYNYNKVKNKITKVDIEQVEYEYIEYDYEFDNEVEFKLFVVETELKKLHWYDQKIFDLYHNEGLSIRKLSKHTKISASSIFNTLKNGNTKIKQAYNKAKKESTK